MGNGTIFMSINPAFQITRKNSLLHNLDFALGYAPLNKYVYLVDKTQNNCKVGFLINRPGDLLIARPNLRRSSSCFVA